MSSENNSQNEEEMQQHLTKQCSKCGILPEQYLALQCDHNLCLSCSIKQLSRKLQNEKVKQNQCTLICDLCTTVTVLDPNTLQTLKEMQLDENQESQEYYNKEGNQPVTYLNPQTFENSGQKAQEYSPQGNNTNTTYTQYDQQNSEKTPQTANNKHNDSINTENQLIIQNCQEHQDEPAALYCFTCYTSCICVECLVTGFHKDHEVRNVRKAFSRLPQLKEHLKSVIKNRMDSLLTSENNLTIRKREIIDLSTKVKEQIRNSFDDLRQRIDKKEKELLAHTDKFVIDKASILDTKRNELKQQLEKQLNIYEKVEEISRIKKEVTAFNLFSQCKTLVERQVEETTQQNHDLIDLPDLSHIRVFLDTKSLNDFVENLKNIKMKITSLRSIDDIKDVTNEEKYYLEKLTQDRLKRRLQKNLEQLSQSNSPENYILNNNREYYQQSTDNIRKSNVIKTSPQKSTRFSDKQKSPLQSNSLANLNHHTSLINTLRLQKDRFNQKRMSFLDENQF